MSRGYGSRSTRKGPIIFGIVIVLIIGGLVGYKVYEAKAAAKIAAVQAEREAARVKKEREAYAKEKADAEAKVIADAKAAADAEAAQKQAQAVTASAQINRVGRSLNEIYTEMHVMINSIVIADDVWEEKLITKENIDALIAEGKNSKNYDPKLLEMLNRWKSGDFSMAASDHNYLWDKVDGTVGKATGVDTGKLPTWAKK